MTTAKVNKKNLTAYWGIEFDAESEKILVSAATPSIAATSTATSATSATSVATTSASATAVAVTVSDVLIPLKKCHSTLLYVGKKENLDEVAFVDFDEKRCFITVDAFGLSKDALAFRVETIKTDEPTPRIVPSFAAKQHITFALRTGVAAKDSVQSLLGQGTITILNEPLILSGKVKRFLY